MVDSTPSAAQYMRRPISTSRYHCSDFVTLSIATPVQSRKPAFKNPVVCRRISHSSNSFKPKFNYGVRAAMGSVQDEKQVTDEKVKELIEYLKVDLPKLFDKGVRSLLYTHIICTHSHILKICKTSIKAVHGFKYFVHFKGKQSIKHVSKPQKNYFEPRVI